MSWSKLVHLVFNASLLIAQPTAATTTSPALFHPVESDEILSYQCARSIATLVGASDQVGPLFSAGQLVFTSLVAQDTSKLLLVNAGYGNFSIPLAGEGVNRIRFTLPTGDRGPDRLFFLSYMHGGTLRSRYFDYSESVAPVGHDDLDFAPVTARRADYLQPHLDYAIDETAQATLGAITDGRIARINLYPHSPENCEHISRESPVLAKNLKYNLDLLDVIMTGATPTPRSSSRMPASLPHWSPLRSPLHGRHFP